MPTSCLLPFEMLPVYSSPLLSKVEKWHHPLRSFFAVVGFQPPIFGGGSPLPPSSPTSRFHSIRILLSCFPAASDPLRGAANKSRFRSWFIIERMRNFIKESEAPTKFQQPIGRLDDRSGWVFRGWRGANLLYSWRKFSMCRLRLGVYCPQSTQAKGLR